MYAAAAATTTTTMTLTTTMKPKGFYVSRPSGLFPSPLPQDSPIAADVAKHFHHLGIFLAKALQDSRLVDIPLSKPFLKLMTMGDLGSSFIDSFKTPSMGRSLCESMVSSVNERLASLDINAATAAARKSAKDDEPWFAGVLTQADFEEINPHLAKFLGQLKLLVEAKEGILSDTRLSETEKSSALATLTIPPLKTGEGEEESPAVRLEDLALTFQYFPSSKIFGFDAVDLVSGGGEKDVTLDNVEEYVDLMTDFCLNVGIKCQLDAFKAGFCRVFPIEKLHTFSPEELRLMMCGDQFPSWTREDVLAFTEPKLGYSRESPGFVRFVNVLSDMTGEERKSFLQFTTGCSSLPPGGLANLHPHLTIVRKVDAGDTAYPSVNTCVHYLKLPEYSSEAVLKERLLAATHEKGFHLN